MPVGAAFKAVGRMLGASGDSEGSVGALAGVSLLGGGIASAVKGSAARKAQAASEAFQAAENEKQRKHEKELKQQEIDRYKNAIAAWGAYDTGAKPLIKRESVTASTGAAPAPAGLILQATQPERRW